MAFVRTEDGALDYAPCSYGASRLVFRGPARALDRPYVAVIGGTESFGKFIPRPWPMLVEDANGVPVVNLSCANVGADAYLADEGALQVARGARAVVVQVTGAVNLSNAFYAVHPRRNDRFVRALPPLLSLYPEVDFTNVHFTRHLMLTLRRVSHARFGRVCAVLRETWVERSVRLMDSLPVPRVLLWMAGHAPGPQTADLSRDPLLVDALMLGILRQHADRYVEVVAPVRNDPAAEGLSFPELDRKAAEGLPGVQAHDAVAQAVARALQGL